MTRYLIDTDWAIDYLGGDPEVTARLQSLPAQTLFLSVISLAELYEGVSGSKDPAAALESLAAFVAGIALVEVNRETARIFGEQRAQLRRSGRMIDNFDLLIASTCLQHGLRLLTNNIAHFDRIQGIQIGLAKV